MKVVCIFPIFNNIINAPKILLEFQNNIAPKLETLGATYIELKFPEDGYTFVGTGQTLEPKGIPKGKGILSCIKNCLNPPDIIISCDGSNKIPYSYIVDIFQELVSDYSLCCVMANRKTNKAIDDFRFLIENFEVFVLKTHYKHNKIIPDGQCGLWGYRNGKIKINGNEKEIELTADGYEIELDILGEVLKKDLPYSFVDIYLQDTPLKQIKTSFKYENNLKKMRFLINKHDRMKDLIEKYFLEFEKDNNIEEYLKESWEKYKLDVLKIQI